MIDETRVSKVFLRSLRKIYVYIQKGEEKIFVKVYSQSAIKYEYLYLVH